MELLKPKDIFKARPAFTFLGGEYFARFLMYILRFNKLNKIYNQITEKQGIDFIDEVTRILKFNIEFDNNELKRIPKTGSLIVVANHPLGGLDGLLLIKYLSMVRPDVKVIANFLLQKIEPVSNYFIADNSSKSNSSDTNLNGTKEAINHLKNNGVLCLFPAGDVSTYGTFNSASDQVWQFPIVKFVKKSKVPVIPIHFQGTNSRLFHFFARIHPALCQVRLPSELLSKRHKTLKIRIGNPIRVAEQDKFYDVYQFGRFLRAKTYSMESKIEVKRFFNYNLKQSAKPERIIDPVPKEKILKEIQKIKQEYTLFSLKNYTVYCAPSKEIPNILNEIGRLREITFREVGEGTNQSIDIDEFDLYYNQMFIWDNDEQRLVGAYRIGKGSDIVAQYGKRGFYLHTLFRIDDKFKPVLNESLELGRSFVIKEYQRKLMPLFLLWKGILFFLLKNPEYRYLIGPVSISNNYSKISKDLIIRFIMSNHLNWRMAMHIKPRNSYKFKSNNPDINILMDNLEHDINRLDKTIGDLDELNSGLPVLLKKYIKLNAKIIGFNVDPKFNNCLDGLIVLDVYDVPKNTVESLSKEVNDGSILERFYSSRE
ncbi:MAG: GNAT family N-acetyltransferase [Prolixibacteraceae bacterium]|jgi:putative hemolysin|nr:GNAT family N-acetyltransferase [Prolixibacteraceae bacterium]MBT6007393.1 GNAT family N-acetyltransferase [Prolixibacteraceae bacterium]MBT6765834.1 GNAT family N-acetyltransferase [Prolixibacteraceae bacterium]MBT7000012.1 GNAT family N-acetyltransferase [Prolixibacteraceae bacterium]MBT7395488.1 GNAT family N-acetyltransferase [Prolixibacteraceae bacterium]